MPISAAWVRALIVSLPALPSAMTFAPEFCAASRYSRKLLAFRGCRERPSTRPPALSIATLAMTFIDGFYWDADDQTRTWSKQFFDKRLHHRRLCVTNPSSVS
jgi:hypothetical protein